MAELSRSKVIKKGSKIKSALLNYIFRERLEIRGIHQLQVRKEFINCVNQIKRLIISELSTYIIKIKNVPSQLSPSLHCIV